MTPKEFETLVQSALVEARIEMINYQDNEAVDLQEFIRQVLDLDDKDRFPICRKLYVAVVQDMFHTLANELDSMEEIAAKYNVSRRNISNIIRRITWKHVK